MNDTETPLILRHRSGAEWMLHMAGQALAHRAKRQRREALWREVEAMLPCG